MIEPNFFLDVKPDQEENYLRSISTLIEKSRLEERNIDYEMYQQVDQEYKYVTT